MIYLERHLVEQDMRQFAQSITKGYVLKSPASSVQGNREGYEIHGIVIETPETSWQAYKKFQVNPDNNQQISEAANDWYLLRRGIPVSSQRFPQLGDVFYYIDLKKRR